MSLRELFALLRADLLRLTLPVNGFAPTKPSWLKVLNPRFMPVLFVRLARYFYLSRWFRFLSPIFTWLNLFIFGIEFTARCDVGPGLMLPHTVGTVVGATKIGANVTIFQGVTLGAKYADLIFNESKRPVIEDDVVIGAGAKVLGGIIVGAGAKIGPNTVVFDDIPAGVIAMGNPTQIQSIKTKGT